MFFDYQGQKVFYERRGLQGPAVLALHGWGCNHKEFDSFIDILTLDYQVYLFDLPGFGESDEPKEVWGVEEYTRMIETFCSENSIESPSLISHSFGGRISLLFASRNSVERMVLIDAAGVKPKRSLKYYLKVYSYKCLKFVCLKVLCNEALLGKYRSKAGSSDYNNASPKMRAVLSKTVNEDLKAVMPKIKAPTLLFWGELDSATPLSDAKIMEKLIPDAGLVVVPGAGHFSFLTAQDLIRSVLRSFFKI